MPDFADRSQLLIKNVSDINGHPRPIRLHLPACPELRPGEQVIAFRYELNMHDIERYIMRGDVQVAPTTAKVGHIQRRAGQLTPNAQQSPVLLPSPFPSLGDYDVNKPRPHDVDPADLARADMITEEDLTAGVEALEDEATGYETIREEFVKKLEEEPTPQGSSLAGGLDGDIVVDSDDDEPKEPADDLTEDEAAEITDSPPSEAEEDQELEEQEQEPEPEPEPEPEETKPEPEPKPKPKRATSKKKTYSKRRIKRKK